MFIRHEPPAQQDLDWQHVRPGASARTCQRAGARLAARRSARIRHGILFGILIILLLFQPLRQMRRKWDDIDFHAGNADQAGLFLTADIGVPAGRQNPQPGRRQGWQSQRRARLVPMSRFLRENGRNVSRASKDSDDL
jgi:hypothetical protein